MRKAILLLALVPFLVISCSGSKATKKVDNPGVLYVEGLELMKKKKWDQAMSKFSQVRENYPFDPIADVATVKLADVQFARKEYMAAAGVYTDFVNSHPDDENVPYVLSRLAECYEKLALTIDRDQTYTLKAIERLTYLQNRYPANEYARDAGERLQKLNQRLADRELYVGDYYYRTGLYNAAALRLEYLLSKYPGAKGTDKALFILAATYKQLADAEKSRYYTDILAKRFPNSTYLKVQPKKEPPSKAPRTSRSFAPAGASTAQKPLMLAQNDSGVDAGAKSIDREATAGSKASDARDAVLAISLAGDEKKPRKIELRPSLPETTLADGKEQATDTAGQGTAEEAKKKEVPKRGAKNTFGFFSEKKPVDIVADMMEGLEQGKIIIFKGHVVTKQDDLQIFSDTLTAYLNEESNEVEKADAKGNVKILKAERTATCNEAFFENAKGEITLKGDVVVYSGPDRLAGDTVIYYINEDRVTVTGEKDKRARVTVQPK